MTAGYIHGGLGYSQSPQLIAHFYLKQLRGINCRIYTKVLIFYLKLPLVESIDEVDSLVLKVSSGCAGSCERQKTSGNSMHANRIALFNHLIYKTAMKMEDYKHCPMSRMPLKIKNILIL